MKGSETIKVIRTPKVDRLDDAPTGIPPEHEITGCIILPRQINEAGQGWITIEGYDVYAPYGSDILETDRIVARGRSWNVDGRPADYVNTHGKGKIMLVKLKRAG